MKTLAHISDLHFGTVLTNVAEGLLRSLQDLQPDLVVVSGDFTQRARTEEFKLAQQYLRRIPYPQLSIPGNHDVPLYSIIRRFFSPLKKYQYFINHDLSPFHLDDEIAVLGINTAHPLTFKYGRISARQIHVIRRHFCSLPNNMVKILVTHHPFVSQQPNSHKPLSSDGQKIFRIANHCSPDILLAGHFHMSYAANVRAFYTTVQYSTLVIQAGTAISSRTRHETNAYNAIKINSNHLKLSVRIWNGEQFTEQRQERYDRDDRHWIKCPPRSG